MYLPTIVIVFVVMLLRSNATAQCPVRFRAPEGKCLMGCLFDSDCEPREICCTSGCYNSCVRLTKCQLERRRVHRRAGVAPYIPQCDQKGHFKQIQCRLNKPKVTVCWRVNFHGQKVPNSEISVKMGTTNTQVYPKGQNGMQQKKVQNAKIVSTFLPMKSKCFKRRMRRLKIKKKNPRAFVPSCKPNGKFKRIQCNASAKKCWCVNPTTGRKIRKTEERNGILPNCRQGCGRKVHRRRRIVGGTVSVKGEWPWQAALFFKGTQHKCGGALIKPSWVITAAHCFSNSTSLNKEDWQIRLGEHSFLQHERSEINIGVADIVIHPKYTAANITHPGDYDIALVRLNGSVQLRNPINTICLPDRWESFKPGQRCVIAGWGKTSWNGQTSPVLREAWIDLVSRDTCNAKKSYDGKISKRFLCAGFKEGGTDACAFDSGGPLMCPSDDGRWVLAGIISWGEKCAVPFKYGVYVNVLELLPWISRSIRLDR